MALSGNLQDVGLPDILQLLAAQGKSGVLTLRRGEESVRIGLVDGMAVHADSSQRSLYQRLGRMLVLAGRLSREDLRRALAIQKQSGKKLGQVLVAEGLVAREDVRRALSLQFLQIVYGVLRWEDGSYDFERSEVEYDRDHAQPVSVQGILMDGMRMIDEWPRIEKRLAHRQTILHRVPGAGAAAAGGKDCDPDGDDPQARVEAEVLARIDGRTTIQQVIDRSLHLEFDVCRAIYDLWERQEIGPAFDGRLDEIGFPDLVFALRSTRATGDLVLRRGDLARTVTFRAGDFHRVDSGDPDDGIGPYLLSRDLISRQALEAARSAPGSPDDLGERLVRAGLVGAEDLQGYRLEQMAAVILSLFSWTEGTYRYQPGGGDETAGVGLEGRSSALILRGLQSIDRWSRIERAVGPADTVYRVRDDRPSVWEDLPVEHRRMLRLFAGGLSAAEACAHSDVPQYFLHQLIWAGKVLGVLDGPEPARPLALLVSALSGTPATGPGEDAPAAEANEVWEDGMEGSGAASKARSSVPAAAAPPSDGEFDFSAIAMAVAGKLASNPYFEEFGPAPVPAPSIGEPAPVDALDPMDLAPDPVEAEPPSPTPPSPVPPPRRMPDRQPPIPPRRSLKPEPSGVAG